MKHFKILSIALGLMISAFAVQAQDAKADKIIAKAQAKLDKMDDLQAKFKYTLANPNLDKPIIKSGNISLKGNKYRIVFTDEEMVCNSRYTWVILRQDEEVIKNCFDAEEGMSPTRIFDLGREDFKSRYDGVEGGTEKVTLFAKNDAGDIWKTELWINQESQMLDKVTMHARNGTTYTYEMQGVKMNTGVADGTFNVSEAEYESKDWIITDMTDGC